MGFWKCWVQNSEEECHEYGLSISRDVYRKAGDCLQLKKEHMGKGKPTTEHRRQKKKL
jgi:hypothetical protein